MLVILINTVSGQLLVMSYEPYITHYTRQTYVRTNIHTTMTQHSIHYITHYTRQTYVHTNIHTTMTQHIVYITLHITLDRHTYIQTYIQL